MAQNGVHKSIIGRIGPTPGDPRLKEPTPMTAANTTTPATGWHLVPATGWHLTPATGWHLVPATGWH
jgi:hypothetical protein